MEGLRYHKPSYFFFVSVLFLAYAAVSSADISDDEYWRKKAEEAEVRAHAAYDPDPEGSTFSFNREVHRALERNSTRRGLRRRYTGPCLATNPIDQCWRCRKNWDRHRKQLALCAKGFGYRTTGGKNGAFYVVTDPSDDDLVTPRPGTLRYGVIQPEPLWIIFARSMTIRLAEELMINSDKTIDGRGALVTIQNGAQLTIQNQHNIIIHNIRIKNIRAASGAVIRDSLEHYGVRGRTDGDGISVLGSTNIWIDHVSMSNCEDGLIDVINASTAVTISNSHFAYHNDVLLLGADNENEKDTIMQVTVAFNHFGEGLVQRMPRCRWGFFHVVTKRESMNEAEWRNWVWRSEGDVLRNGAFFIESGGLNKRSFSSRDYIKARPGTWVRSLTRFAGWLNCRVGKPC
ncbi:Pectate lyase [Ananas comosus]|uniref:Pectate lyase n=1 Tax=Ananas comosus TaxID=4615 RepID=A0A199UE86_ANACO|nr:Pectate lyase [Ananas comosus]